MSLCKKTVCINQGGKKRVKRTLCLQILGKKKKAQDKSILTWKGSALDGEL